MSTTSERGVEPVITASPARHRDSVVVVTGGASGIGRACVRRLLDEGARVLLADINGPGAADAAAGMAAPDRVVPVGADISAQHDCDRMFSEALTQFGRVTGLINAAGINSPKQPLTELATDQWSRVIDVNLTGTLYAIQAAARHLGPGGAIVTIASGAGRVARPGAAAYCASKAGVLMLTKVAALELGPSGVRVNSIAPGFIDTEMNREKLTDDMRQRITRSTPLRRVGEPAEIASVAAFLLSAEASYISGDLIAVDGGVAAPSRP